MPAGNNFRAWLISFLGFARPAAAHRVYKRTRPLQHRKHKRHKRHRHRQNDRHFEAKEPVFLPLKKGTEAKASPELHGIWKEKRAGLETETDLDALLLGDPSRKNTEDQPVKKEPLKAIAHESAEDFVFEERAQAQPAPEQAQEGKGERATASAELLGLPMETTEKTREPLLKREKERKQTKETIEAMKEKEAREKEKEEKKEKERSERPQEEIHWKPIVRSRTNGFVEFLGAIRSIGMGRMKLALIQNLATMLNAGLPLIDALRTLEADTRSGAMKRLLRNIVEMVENGNPLWRALEAQHCFSPDIIALVRIGEEAGDLAENMEYLAAQQEKDMALRSKVKMAMIYPTIVLVMMLVIVIGLGMFVLPNLITVLITLNVELPLVTRLVIAFTNFFTTQGPIAIPATLAGLVFFFILARFTPLRIVAQWVIFQIPGIGRLAREATIARFGVILGGLLQAGVPLTDAMHSLAEVTSIVSYRKFYTRLLDHIVVGDTFGRSFAAIRGSAVLLPISMQQLITTGERSGSLTKVLLKVADIYEKKANDTAQKLPIILEPMLLLFIGALVGTIAFAIIVPIYSIVGNVGGG